MNGVKTGGLTPFTPSSLEKLLENMPNNGCLRLKEIDLTIMKDHLSEEALQKIEQFIECKSLTLDLLCPTCKSCIRASDTSNWKCDHCCFYYHELCSCQFTVEYEKSNYIFCEVCYSS